MNIPVDKLRDYQVAPVRTLVAGLDRFNGLLDASDMGVGKTYAALGTAFAVNRRPVVICRNAAIPSWQRVSEHFGIRDMVAINYEMVKTGNTPLGEWRFHRKKVADKKNPGQSIEKKIMRFDWLLKPNDLAIFDEVHWCKGMDTDNSELLIAATAQRIKTISLSATAANNPMHMKALGYSLGLHHLSDYYPWMLKNGVNKTKFGFSFDCGMKFYEIKRNPGRLAQLQAVAMRGIHHQIFGSGRGVRVQKKDVPGFPMNQIIPVAVDFGKHKEAINSAYARLEQALKTADKDKKLPILRATQMEIERLKVPGLIDEARNMAEDGRHVVIFVNFTETVKAMCEGLKTNCCVYGDQNDIERQRCIDDFQADIEPFLVTNIQAGGESLSFHDLHGNFPRGSIVCPCSWSELMIQAFGRIPRNGAMSDCVQKVPFAAGTIEEQTMKNFERVSANIAALNDGDLLPSSICKLLRN